MFTKLFKLLLLLLSILSTGQALSENTIKVGMSNALTGPISNLGQALNQGTLIYFKQLNNSGGINGQKVELISLDDGYDPQKAVINTKTLIQHDNVLALLNFLGAPTSHAILPILKQTNIPYLMPVTGADFLRVPAINNIFNLRTSYLQEAQAQIDYLVKEKGFSRMALVIQADEFGLAAQRSYVKILKKYNLEAVVNERFKRNSSDMESVVNRLKAIPLDAVIFVGTYHPFVNLLNLSYEQNIRPYFSALSFVSSQDVFLGLKHPSKVVISEVMPEPYQCQWTICKKFIHDMKTAGYQDLNRIQLEGYLGAHIFSLAAKECGSSLTRACLLKELNSFKYKQGGLDVSFSNSNHQALNLVYLSLSDAIKAEQASKK